VLVLACGDYVNVALATVGKIAGTAVDDERDEFVRYVYRQENCREYRGDGTEADDPEGDG
jgi:hypothetical protein